MQHIRREEKSRILLVSCVPVAEVILISETVVGLQEKKDRYHPKLYMSFAGWYFKSFLIYIQVPEALPSQLKHMYVKRVLQVLSHFQNTQQ